MRNILLIITVFAFHGCFPGVDAMHGIKKEIKNEDIIVQWIGRSTAFAEVPDIVIARTQDQIDTLCIAQNITDIGFYTDFRRNKQEIIIGFKGNPRRYGIATDISSETVGYKIIADTNYIETNDNRELMVYHGGIIDEKEVFSGKNVKTRFTPDRQHVIFAERLLEDSISYIEENESNYSFKITDNLDKYWRQYVGFIDNNGDEVIWINFLIDEFYNPAYLSRGILYVDDGGCNYWSVYVNLTQKKLYGISINGVA